MLFIAIGIDILCDSGDASVIDLTQSTHSSIRAFIFSGSCRRKYVLDMYLSSSEYAFHQRAADQITGAYFGLSFQISLY